MQRKGNLIVVSEVLKPHWKNAATVTVNRERVDNQTNILQLARRDSIHGIIKCKCCGIESAFWALEKSGNLPYHLNLYAFDNLGNFILLTVDHIFPLSKGGKDILENTQILCVKCNERKADNEPILKGCSYGF